MNSVYFFFLGILTQTHSRRSHMASWDDQLHIFSVDFEFGEKKIRFSTTDNPKFDWEKWSIAPRDLHKYAFLHDLLAIPDQSGVVFAIFIERKYIDVSDYETPERYRLGLNSIKICNNNL